MQSSTCSDALNEIKTQFITREGIYRIIPGAEYCRPKVSTYGPVQSTMNNCNNTAPPVRMSFTKAYITNGIVGDAQNNCDRYSQNISNQSKQRYNYENCNPNTSSLQRNPPPPPRQSNSLSSSQSSPSNRESNHDDSEQIIEERICFNVGREIFIYTFNGLQV